MVMLAIEGVYYGVLLIDCLNKHEMACLRFLEMENEAVEFDSCSVL